MINSFVGSSASFVTALGHRSEIGRHDGHLAHSDAESRALGDPFSLTLDHVHQLADPQVGGGRAAGGAAAPKDVAIGGLLLLRPGRHHAPQARRRVRPFWTSLVAVIVTDTARTPEATRVTIATTAGYGFLVVAPNPASCAPWSKRSSPPGPTPRPRTVPTGSRLRGPRSGGSRRGGVVLLATVGGVKLLDQARQVVGGVARRRRRWPTDHLNMS